MIIESKKYIHWNYFLSIEGDVETLARYVEFTKDNFGTYSIEMARLLLSASSEVDVVAKLLCKKINNESKAENINDYKEILDPAYPDLKNIEILLRKYGLTFTPWSNWQENKNPLWWTKYNAVKHERDKNFEAANLKNTLNCVAGLYVILLHYYQEDYSDGNLQPPSMLFRIADEYFL